ncbi:MAG: chemotaxis-specific protein-glutamate methyltransferase CheB [Myxococcales bacterium]|jgi:two-component system chemotaxis response regulator CheB|nr:chemotaxis-specific protein-glutamate methyltransferase CheB [Myxococcales bacterium]
MMRILIAEDSTTVQRTLVSLLAQEPGIEIVGIANNGLEAVAQCHRLKPDLITMDIFMPQMNGLEATRTIMAECPTRIVIISSMVGSRNITLAFDAMRAGAVEIIEKPGGVLTGNYAEVKKTLLNVIQKARASRPTAQLSWLPPPASSFPPAPLPKLSTPAANAHRHQGAPSGTEKFRLEKFPTSLICIGGSTGAPTVIMEILAQLPADFSLPIVIAQHISRGFAKGMTAWLDNACALPIRLASPDERPAKGTVLVAPDDCHTAFNDDGRLLFRAARNDGHIPSIDGLFETAARTFRAKAAGILLSGMGKDGANGLLQMRTQGGLTICQSEATSVVYGMPRVAKELGAAHLVLSPHEIATTLLQLDQITRRQRAQ